MFRVSIWVQRRQFTSRNRMLELFVQKAELIIETGRQESKF